MTGNPKFYIIACNSFCKNPLFQLFPIQKHKGPNLTLPLNRSRSTQGHHLNKLGSTWALDATYWVSRHRPFCPGEEDFLRFLPYMCIADILVMWPIPFEQTFVPPVPRRLHMKFGFRGEDVWKWWHTYTDEIRKRNSDNLKFWIKDQI